MSERTAVLEAAQFGVESTAGTAVAADKHLTGLQVTPSIEFNTEFMRGSGQKYPVQSVVGREWTTAAVDGAPNYTELVYLLSSLIAPAAITTPGGGTNSRDWTFTPTTSAEHVPQTYTVEVGQSVRAGRFAYGIVNSLDLDFPAQQTPSLSGGMVGQAYEDNVTMTASPTEIALQPIKGGDFCLHLDSTSGGLGTTELTRVMNVGVSFPAQRDMGWFHACASTDWTAPVEIEGGEPVITAQMVAESQAMAQLSNARNGTTQFMRLEALGSVIEAAITYKLRIDAAVKVESVNPLGESNGLVAGDVVFRAVHDDTWDKAFEIVVTNDLTAL